MDLRKLTRAIGAKPHKPQEKKGVIQKLLSSPTRPVGGSATAILEEQRAHARRSPAPARQRKVESDPGLREVHARLRRFGASNAFAHDILRRVRASGARGTHAIDAAVGVIGKMFRVSESPKKPQAGGVPHLIAFTGPAGAGKTTVLARLGRRLSAAGRRVLYVTLDPLGVSALQTVGGLDADVDRTEVPLLAVRSAAELRRVLKKARDFDVALLDTPGLSPRSGRLFDRFARELRRIRRWDHTDDYLVLPASSGRSALDLVMRTFKEFGPSGVVLSKLDETREPGLALEQVARADLPIAFLCDGQDMRFHLTRPNPDRLTDLLLLGRLS